MGRRRKKSHTLDLEGPSVALDEAKKVLREMTKGLSGGEGLIIYLIEVPGGFIVKKPYQILAECLQRQRGPRTWKRPPLSNSQE